MQNRYTGDIGDFGKFLLLKSLFPDLRIGTIWYLYPDENHNNDGKHIVASSNPVLFERCRAVDPNMAELFERIHMQGERYVGWFKTFGILDNGHYFEESVIGRMKDHRTGWLERVIEFIRDSQSEVVALDPDNGLEPHSMLDASSMARGKYAGFEEVKRFFEIESVSHCVLYQHFNRLKKHDVQMLEAKERFENHFGNRAHVSIIRHNPVQPRFYIVLSKPGTYVHTLDALHDLLYDGKRFFSVYEKSSL